MLAIAIPHIIPHATWDENFAQAKICWVWPDDPFALRLWWAHMPHVALLAQRDANAGERDATLHVFLAGTFGHPALNMNFLNAIWRTGNSEAAGLDQYALGLSYPYTWVTSDVVGQESNAKQLHEFHSTICFGGDEQKHTSAVSAQHSIVGRVASALRQLAADEKERGVNQNWGQFLKHDGKVDWTKVILSGHSQGGSHAAFIAQKTRLRRCGSLRHSCFTSTKFVCVFILWQQYLLVIDRTDSHSQFMLQCYSHECTTGHP